MRRLLLLPVLALVGVMFVATPASAATIENFTIDGSSEGGTAFVGQTVLASFDVRSARSWVIEPAGNAANNPGVIGWDPSDGGSGGSDGEGGPGDENRTYDVTFLAPGTYEFAVRVTESDQDPTVSNTITIIVEPEPTEIPVPAVTFPEPCVAFLPEDPNVNYGVSYGQFANELEAGLVDLTELLENGIPQEIVAVPNEGFAFAEGADNRFEVPDLEDCFGEFVDSGIVDVDAICQAVTFTNLLDETVFVAYTDADFSELGDEFELAAGASRTVDTDLDLLVSFAAPESDEVLQVNEVEVEQDCTPASAGAAFPTVAPAAGSDGGSAAGLGALVALTLAGGAALGARRLRRTA